MANESKWRTPRITEITKGAEPVRAAIGKAKKELRAGDFAGDRASVTPTPERAARAGDRIRQDAVRAYHCEDCPIEKLAARGALAPYSGKDRGAIEMAREKNHVLLQAGRRYYEHWYLSGLNGVSAIDLTRAGGGDGSPAYGMPTTQLAAHHRKEYRAAVAALTERRGDRFLAAIDPVVLGEQDIDAIATAVSGYRDRGKAIAVTMDRLRGALECLAVHFHIWRLDAVRTTMDHPCHDSQKRPERSSRALSRHRTLAGM